MKTLSLDLETYSSVDLGKSSVYRYVESPDFDILLLGFSTDGSPVQVVDLAQGEQIPPEIIDALSDERVHKWAFNANFERICLSEWLRRNSYPLHNEHYSTPDDPCMGYLDPVGWHCSMVWSAYLGLPLSLKDAGAALGLDKQKLTEGKDLIKYFCVPGKDGQRHLPADAPDKWSTFKAYNLRDVETEMGIQERLRKYPVPDAVWDQYHLDQQINDRGLAVDMALVRSAISIDERSREELTAKLKELTMLDNPNSVQQMKDWLADNGLETETLGKKQVAELLKTAPEPLRSVLVLRQQLAKSSVKKYQVMEATVCADGRVRGCFQFYGARTGRWAGRNIQLQNLPQNKMPDLEQARAIVRAGDYDAVRMLYDSTPDVLSQLIRTAFVPRSGHTFFVADFSAIEARVIAWLAGEDWRQQVFAEGKDIYCASASQMFGVPVEKHREVLRSIDQILSEDSGYSAEFNRCNFAPISYTDVRGRKQRCYALTRDGFTALVMGFTGKKAARFKEFYIKRFNEMERFIGALVSAREQFPKLTAQIRLLHPDAKPYNPEDH